MIIQTLPSGPFETNAYVVACPKTRIAAVVDPAPESFAPISDCIAKNQLHPEKVLLTHSHWDHIAEVSSIKEKYHLTVCIHPIDVPNLEKPGSDGLPCWIPIKEIHPDVLLNDGDVVAVGELHFEVMHTPGHTPGSICFYCKDEGVLISGDTLFKGTIGNLSFPTSRPDLMWNSLAKLAKLPPETRVFPGHGPNTTIGEESWLPNAKKIFG
jgi:hydroxyacylglutathione hydrolase